MAVLRPEDPAERGQLDAEGIATLATRQHGVVSRRQLLIAGVGSSTIDRWRASGRLHLTHPGVFALGHAALSLWGRISAALLYGGDEAVLSHTTAAWAWKLIDVEPTRIHLTVPGRRSSLPGVRVHHSRQIERAEYRDLPVTSVPRTSSISPRRCRSGNCAALWPKRSSTSCSGPRTSSPRPGADAADPER